MKQSKWINVSDYPSEDFAGTEFLIYWEFKYNKTKGYALAKYFGNGIFSANNKYYDSRHVVYYMPLPDAPECD